MESIGKLRELPLAEKMRLAAKGGFDGAVGRVVDNAVILFDMDCKDAEHVFKALADEIEREIAEKYMEKPLDADGKVINIGDELEFYGEPFTVAWIEYEEIGVYVGKAYKDGKIPYAFGPGECIHVKPDPVRELLEEFANSGTATGNGGVLFEVALIDEYAARIREAVGV